MTRLPIAGIRLALHILVWAGAGLLYLLAWYPLARVLALDLQALLVNVAQDHSPTQPAAWYADPAWSPAGELAIKFGPAPLLVLVTATLCYRLLPRRLELDQPLQGIARRHRMAIGALVWGALATAALPLALALGVWLQVEAYWWIQWYGNLDFVLEQIRQVAPLAMLPGLALVGLWATWRSLRRPPPARRRRWRWARRLGAALAVLLLLAPVWVALALHGPRVIRAPGPTVFEQKCGGCHDLALSLYYIKTPVEWQRTIKTQEQQEGVRLSGPERQAVLGYLLGSRSFSNSWTFRTRCQRCHLSISWDDRTPADWAALTARLARWSPYYFRPDARAQVVAHLSRTRSRPDARLGLDRASYEAYQKLNSTCSRCHSLSRQAEHYRTAPAARTRLLRRMNRKLTRPLAPGQLSKLTQSYHRLLSDPRLLQRLFPHDLPVAEGWVPW